MIVEGKWRIKGGYVKMKDYCFNSNCLFYLVIAVLFLILIVFGVINSMAGSTIDSSSSTIYEQFFIEVPEMYQNHN